MRSRRLTLACMAIALLACVASGAAAASRGTSDESSTSTAGESVAACSEPRGAVPRRACIERAVRADIDAIGLDGALERLERAARADPGVAADCHMALHPLGADAGERLARSDARLPLVRPRSFCHEGYVHGMQVAWLDAAPTPQLIRDGARSCDASDANVDWACGHSLGHVLARRAGAAGMPTAAAWCASTYRGAVRLGLDREAFLTTCMKGSLMEYVLLDERADATDRARHACGGVRRDLLPWCEGHVWLRADVASDRTPTVADRLAACDELATTRVGRIACAGMVGRGASMVDPCGTRSSDLADACAAAAGRGPIDPAAIPAR